MDLKRIAGISVVYPACIEEIMLSLKYDQPIFLVGAYGGVASLVIDVLEGRPREEMSWEYQNNAPHSCEVRELYEEHGQKWQDYPDIINSLQLIRIARLNTLSEPENHELFHTNNLDRIVELIVLGLDRLK